MYVCMYGKINKFTTGEEE